jgi:ribosome-binding protein aMBF1 (putative translation factor)
MVAAISEVRRLQRVSEVLERAGMTEGNLISRSGLDDRVVQAIVNDRYTPSPQQRQRVAAALGMHRNELWWGHAYQVERLHGPV